MTDSTKLWMANMYAQSMPTILAIVAEMKRQGDRVDLHVIVVAEPVDAATRYLVSLLTGAPVEADTRQFFGAIPTDMVVVALRAVNADCDADWLEQTPRTAGAFRVLTAARGECLTLDIEPPMMSSGGTA